MIPQLLTDANDENKACSPINIYMALAMLAEVTDGQSREQILDVLGSENLDALRKEASAVWNANYCNDGTVTSVLASSLWLNDQLEFKQDAMNALAMYYYASSFRGEMGSEDFNKALQDWINEQTGGLLSEQASGLKMDPETILALATTVYFRVKWDYEFAESNTTEDTFHSDAGDVKCNFMHASSDDTYYWSDHFSAVAKGLENSGAMWFLLPDESITPEKLLSEDETLDFLLSGGESAESDRYIVNLSIPKFDISSDKRLLEDLKAVGISDVFNAEKADFSPMTDDSEVALTQAQHAARAAIDEEGVVTLSCAEELAEGELRTARLGTIERLVEGAYVGPTKIVVSEGVRFTLGRAQTIDATIEGAGRFGVSDGQFWGLRNSTMTGFTGILELGPSARVYPTMESQGFGGGGAAQIVMKGAEISCGNDTGAYLDKPFEIVEGTANNIWSVNGNRSVGALTGKGYLTYNTSEKRGPQLKGDNREFEGTVRLYSGRLHVAPPTGFYGNHAGSAKAVWLLQDDWAIYRDGNITYTLMDQDVNGDPIQFGAFCQTGANAWIRAGSTKQNRDGMKIEVGAREDVDSVINGKFTCSRIAFTKVGAKSCLMLGTGFGAEANSTFNFAEGTLGFNLPGADGAMTTLTSYGVTIAEGVKIRVAMTQAQYEALDLNEEYLVAKLPTNPGYKPETALLVDGAVLDTPAAAKWCVRFKSFPAVGETPAYVGVVLCRRFAGLMIIVK